MDLGLPYHVGMVVGDLQAAKTMLGGVLGARWAEDMHPNVRVEIDGEVVQHGVDVAYSVDGPPFVELIRDGEGRIYRAPDHNHLGFFVDDVDTASEALRRRGLTCSLLHRPDDGPPLFACFANPHGLAIEVVHRSIELALDARKVAVPGR